MNKNQLKALAADPHREDDFLTEFAQAYGSACEIWMDSASRDALRRKYASGRYEFKAISDDGYVNDQRAHRRHQQLTLSGWKLLDYDQNVGRYDAVYYKARRRTTR